MNPLIPSAASRSGNDPIFALNAEAQRRAAAGESVVNATLGALMDDDGRLSILPSVVEALAQVPAQKAAAYAPIAGSPPFLQAVVADVFGDGPLAAQTVAAATPGGSGALTLAITNFLEPGQALLTTDFYWGPYHTMATHTGRAVETFPMFAANGGFDVAAFDAALQRQVERQGRALVFLNSPCHNPTGYSLDADEWRAVAASVRRCGERAPVTLLIDLAYARFAAAQVDWVELVQPVLDTATLLVAWSASKSFAQYGARVGAVLATHRDPEQRQRIQAAFSFACRGTWSNCNHLGQLAITGLLADPAQRARADLDRARLIALLDERVTAWNREAQKAGLRYPRYEGGFFVTVFCDDAEAAAARAREDGVFVVPVRGDGRSALRVALCSTSVAAVPRVVAALQRAVG
ncbi:MAG: aminotransferase class I/II-fold pyridoxal phosphate-dependent enzyme [Planctomycetes bacterium]|nr:aminotransferase class I/II-fold pyridoxal phosphate-dependent enzyme [Planctomycetota bacterium]